MANLVEKRHDNHEYLMVRHDKAGIVDIVKYFLLGDVKTGQKFLQSSSGGQAETDDSESSIFVSLIARKIMTPLKTPMVLTGSVVEFILNLLSLNGNLFQLTFKLFFCPWNVVLPQRGKETFVSAIGHLDKRRDLYKSLKGSSGSEDVCDLWQKGIQRPLLDLCMMASKLAYENSLVVKTVVIFNWQMHFEDFFDGWNDFRQEWSTQVFIICDKPVDADLILVSFRGTEPFDAEDWATDFDYSWYQKYPWVGKVHVGFLEDLGLGNRARPETIQAHLEKKKGDNEAHELTKTSAYYLVREKLKGLVTKHKNAQIVVTGHSLGGALAILFPTVLAIHDEKELMDKLVGVFTFGQPRIGDSQLKSFMQSKMEFPTPKYFRVVYSYDMVPRVPFDDNFFSYKHFGECIYYDSCFNKQDINEEPDPNFFGLKYLIPTYANGVWELMRSFIMGFQYGEDYEEGWYSVLNRITGLFFPGCSAHLPINYINAVRIGKLRND